jgi:predicted Zn-dependent protease
VSWTTPTPSPIRSDPPIFRLLAGALLTLVGLFSVGLLLGSAQGTATATRPSASVEHVKVYIPAPPGRQVFLAPLGNFPPDTVQSLVDFYHQKYGLEIMVLNTLPIDADARDVARDQLVAEELIESMRFSHPVVTNDPDAVVIGLVTEDVYTRTRTDWDWSFGVRAEGRFAIVSTARMTAKFVARREDRERSRLRKMVTRDIGVLYYGMPLNDDPRSVLYERLLSVEDLDKLSEDF